MRGGRLQELNNLWVEVPEDIFLKENILHAVSKLP